MHSNAAACFCIPGKPYENPLDEGMNDLRVHSENKEMAVLLFHFWNALWLF